MKQSRLVIISGLSIGAASVLLMRLGNPANMGICVACFIRDIAGGLGLHRAAAVQYLRPEVPGFILGSMIVSSITREFKPRGGSSPLLRFVLGFFMMIGALVFLGCPLRMGLRLAAGDLNALVGLVGFAAGIWVGLIYLRNGFSLGRSTRLPAPNGAAMPAMAAGTVLLAAARPAPCCWRPRLQPSSSSARQARALHTRRSSSRWQSVSSSACWRSARACAWPAASATCS